MLNCLDIGLASISYQISSLVDNNREVSPTINADELIQYARLFKYLIGEFFFIGVEYSSLVANVRVASRAPPAATVRWQRLSASYRNRQLSNAPSEALRYQGSEQVPIVADMPFKRRFTALSHCGCFECGLGENRTK